MIVPERIAQVLRVGKMANEEIRKLPLRRKGDESGMEEERPEEEEGEKDEGPRTKDQGPRTASRDEGRTTEGRTLKGIVNFARRRLERFIFHR
jgi:hypothetical protein